MKSSFYSMMLAALVCGTAASAAETVFTQPGDPSDQRFAFNHGATVAQGEILADTTGKSGEWFEYFMTNPETLVLGGGKNYKVSYDYAITKVDGDKVQFYHLLRLACPDNKFKDIGAKFFRGNVGDKGHQEFNVTAKEPGYRLILGIQNHGAVKISNLKVEDLTPVTVAGTLFSGPIEPNTGFYLNKSGTIVDGAVIGDSTASGQEWNEFMVSNRDSLIFVPGKTYKIAYDYTVLSVNDKTRFYNILRRMLSKDKFNDIGVALWQDQPEAKGHREFTVKIDGPDYALILGIRNAGKIKIENLKIQETNP